MSKQLIIAEKPSVAQDIAKALGGFTRTGDYFESEDYVLSSAVGHLLELAVPEEYDVKRGKWSFTHLPMIPPHFALNPIEKTQDRLKLLTRLIKRKDVTGLVNACDAGREGELIFRYVAQHALGEKQKPVRRLWLQSMTATAIRDGFAHLRTDKEMQPLADAARCRSEADWLIGINGTRAMTAFNSKEGGFYKTPVGRVQTPTLAIMVEREARIRAFVPRDYWEVEGEFQCVAGSYRGRWFDEKFKKAEDEHARAERLWDKARADAIRKACLGQHGTVEEESKPKTEACPMLYDLTSLQREANGRFGFSAKNTLGLAQALYEKHKALTYPRTDSRHLPEDYIGTVKETLSTMAGTPYATFAGAMLKNGWVHPNKRIFNNAKVSDHFAIIPTGAAPKSLSEPEQKIYDLVTKRFLAIFYPAAEYNITTRITRVEKEAFKTEGKVLVTPGWLAVYGKIAETREATRKVLNLPPLEKERAHLGQGCRGQGQGHPAAAALHGSHTAHRHGGCRQADRRRGTARSHVGARPGHPGDACSDHRRPAGRGISASQRPRTAADGQGLLAAVCAGRSCRWTKSARRSSPANGNSSSRKWNRAGSARDEFMQHIVDKHTRDGRADKDRRIRRSRLRHAADPLPPLWRQDPRRLQAFHLREVRLQVVEGRCQPAMGVRGSR
jgi:DNA topoisomerase-3